jgi:hypothetical protein
MKDNYDDISDMELIEDVVGRVVAEIMVDGHYSLRDVLRRVMSNGLNGDAAVEAVGWYDRIHQPDSPWSKSAPILYEKVGGGTRDEFFQYWAHVRLDDFRRARMWTVTGRKAATETEVRGFKLKMNAIITGATDRN